MTIKVDLPPELEAYVAQKVKRGDYASPEDVIRACLEHQQAEDKRKFEELKALIAEGIAEADRGEGDPLDIDEIMAEVEAEAKAREAQTKAKKARTKAKKRTRSGAA